MSEPVLLDTDGGVATIRLNRADAMNAFDAATRVALVAALHAVGADRAVRAVVLTGTGRAFGVGQDLREHAASLQGATPDEVWRVVPEHYNPIARAVAGLDKPVIAAVNGIAAGAGASLAFLADHRILATSAGYNLAFAGIALSCDTGASWTLPRLVGQARALELLFAPRTIGAGEALALGLATEVVPDDRFAERVAEVAARFASGPTLAYAAMRQAVAYAATHSLDESLEFEAQLMRQTGASADHRAAVDSFLRKEKPRFSGS